MHRPSTPMHNQLTITGAVLTGFSLLKHRNILEWSYCNLVICRDQKKTLWQSECKVAYVLFFTDSLTVERENNLSKQKRENVSTSPQIVWGRLSRDFILHVQFPLHLCFFAVSPVTTTLSISTGNGAEFCLSTNGLRILRILFLCQ